MKQPILLTAVAALFLGANLTADEPVKLKPGQFEWHPERSPEGPVLIVVSRDDQLAYVYRDGIEIARSTVSTGKEGHTTPTGVFHILQKDADHVSSTYKGAPMPYMQRLTWGGIALHAGNLPGYPASHGCIRLPYQFSKLLYGITHTGATVVVTSEHGKIEQSTTPWKLLSTVADDVPFEVQKKMFGKETPVFWEPKRQREGHLSIIISGKDHAIHVLRNGVQIGQCPIAISDKPDALPHAAFVMLSKTDPGESPLVPGAPRHHWATVSIDRAPSEEALWAFTESLHLPRDFAKSLYEALEPGTLLLFTPNEFHEDFRSKPGFTIARAEKYTEEAPPKKD